VQTDQPDAWTGGVHLLNGIVNAGIFVIWQGALCDRRKRPLAMRNAVQGAKIPGAPRSQERPRPDNHAEQSGESDTSTARTNTAPGCGTGPQALRLWLPTPPRHRRADHLPAPTNRSVPAKERIDVARKLRAEAWISISALVAPATTSDDQGCAPVVAWQFVDRKVVKSCRRQDTAAASCIAATSSGLARTTAPVYIQHQRCSARADDAVGYNPASAGERASSRHPPVIVRR